MAHPIRRTAIVLILLMGLTTALHAQKRPVTFVDLMQFRTVDHPSISKDGAWIAFTAQPDRGDPEVVVRSIQGGQRHTVAQGSHPVLSADGAWVAMRRNPTLAATETAKKGKPKQGLSLLNTATGAVVHVDSVASFAFSADGRWLAYHRMAPKPQNGDAEGKGQPGTPLVLRALATGTETPLADVRAYAFDEAGPYLAYSVATTAGEGNGLHVRDLRTDAATPQVLDARPDGHYSAITWSEANGQLAFLVATEDEDAKPGPAALALWDGTRVTVTNAAEHAPNGWNLPADNTLRWSDDGQRLFLGFRPAPEEEAPEDTTAAFAPYNLDAILADREVDVWHWNDPLINTHQKARWKAEQARTYDAVYHLDSGRTVALADRLVHGQGTPQNGDVMLGRAEAPYHRERTWEGTFFDAYTISLHDGTKTPVAQRLSSTASLSPGGRYVAYYDNHHWHIYDVASGQTRTVTDGLGVPFANEDHDYPSQVPGYGVGGWVGDEAVLVYDKYDIWQIPTATTGTATRLTGGAGRSSQRTFRILRTDPDQRTYRPGETLLLSSYHNRDKNYGFYQGTAGQAGVTALLEEAKRFRFIAKAEAADAYLYSREAYDEFPDLWVGGSDFRAPKKLTRVNPQMDELAWGTSELVSWRSADGIPLQGVVIKPTGYEPGKRYPVLVYFYRFFSQRLHEFNEPVVNHRPSFPVYAADGYVVFLPDVRFEIGRPGLSAMKAIVPGVQKLIDMGLADPDAIGLHGHSWSGYQTAHIVTQTDFFTAAVAGAPVSNMTSAYSGIRWASGLARQFQYEKTQSRLGATLWEARDRYIDNSPVFFADKINTPMLLMFGDEDGAVPWYQGIELYLALRRLGKEAVFLQYRGEGHHPQKYANKLDYAIKMKAYLDHYLKGKPAPAWMTEGVPYNGK